jgi:hypothetical protein
MNPLLHYVHYGRAEGRLPLPKIVNRQMPAAALSAGFDPAFYLAQYPDIAAAGMDPLLHYVQFGRAEGRLPLPKQSGAFLPLPAADSRIPNSVSSVGNIVRVHNAAWAPLPVFADHRSAPTLTILTDSVDPDHLFGGVATAMVVGAFIARRLNARLRLATRNVAPDPSALGNILQAHRVDWDGPTDFLHMPPGDQTPLSLGDEDLILTTSWWTTRATLGSVNAARILYLLQEDERMFYPLGDSRLRCTETLSEPDLRILVNTRQLFDHLAAATIRCPGCVNVATGFSRPFRPSTAPAPRPRRGRGRASRTFSSMRGRTTTGTYIGVAWKSSMPPCEREY